MCGFFALRSLPAGWLRFFVLLGAVMGSLCARAQGPSSDAFLNSLPTQERIQQPGWWPTKPLSPTRQSQLAGPQTCAACHDGIARSQEQTGMAHSLMPAAASAVLEQHGQESFSLGPYLYLIRYSRSAPGLTVKQGAQTQSAALEWAFGSGEVGQSYSWMSGGTLYESRFNYFHSIQGFDYTPGHTTPDSFATALGRPLTDKEARGCFACHSTGLTSTRPLNPKEVVPGITCEACHGPGARHVAAAAQNDPKAANLVLSARRLNPSESVDFCGACHGTSWDVRLQGLEGIATVRFPVFRLQQSRCWGNGDARITCVACHDPHKPLDHEAASYDQKCLACHQASRSSPAARGHSAAACPVAVSQCESCHMPKYEVPGMHFKFTDHRIRVAERNAPFPD